METRVLFLLGNQLNGNFEIESRAGLEVRITFPVEKALNVVLYTKNAAG